MTTPAKPLVVHTRLPVRGVELDMRVPDSHPWHDLVAMAADGPRGYIEVTYWHDAHIAAWHAHRARTGA